MPLVACCLSLVVVVVIVVVVVRCLSLLLCAVGCCGCLPVVIALWFRVG